MNSPEKGGRYCEERENEIGKTLNSGGLIWLQGDKKVNWFLVNKDAVVVSVFAVSFATLVKNI